MRLVTFFNGAERRLGVIIGNDVLDPSHQALGTDYHRRNWPDVGSILQDGEEAISAVKRLEQRVAECDRFHAAIREQGALASLDAVRLLAPVPRPSLLLCMGRSYGRHVVEMMGSAARAPAKPNGFLKSPHCVVGPRDPILLPASHPKQVDFEGEIALVFGKRCFGVSVDDALDHVAGYTLINEVSARDWNAPHGQPQDWDMVRLGKQFPSFCPMGPMLVTADETGDPLDMAITTTVNGEVMQDSSTSDLLFSFAEMIAYYAQWYEFHPGDVLSTGTPEGVGASRNPAVFLRSGDVVSISSPRLGTLTNHVAVA